jgi:hypothetical protein
MLILLRHFTTIVQTQKIMYTSKVSLKFKSGEIVINIYI